MTRTEARRQIDSGWITLSLASRLLAYDMDDQRTKTWIDGGVINTRTRAGVQYLCLDDVLAIVGKSIDELLNKYWPINRQKKPARLQRIAVHTSQADRQQFQSQWNRMHKHISKLIAAGDITFGELRLWHQLSELSLRANTFDIVVSSAQLTALTGLDRKWLPRARRALESHGMLSAERDGTLSWFFRLLDPATGKPFADDEKETITVVASASWLEV